jgi:allantoicase
MVDLASTAVGGRIVDCDDEFFAEAVNLLNPDGPVWKEGEYTDRGKWMDGWETRRRRNDGHDWCVVALGIPGSIEQITIDTSFFTGNYPESFSLEGCGVGSDHLLDQAYWVELIAETDLEGDSVAVFDINESDRITHLRLNIFPDGGVARLRVEGRPIPAMEWVCPDAGPVNLASLYAGTEATDASDAHYSPPTNMLRPGEPKGMWDGWETRRRRGPGNDWVSFRLGLGGAVHEVVVDTRHFKGNSPGWVSMDVSSDGNIWHSALGRTAISANSLNRMALPDQPEAEFVKLDIYPDGGVARFAVLGRPASDAAASKRVQYVNSLLGQDATRFFHTACASTQWISEMLGSRPFESAQSIFDTADIAFVDLAEGDWLEAFEGHPRIGERGDEIANREQSAASGSDPQTLSALRRVNEDYEAKFGFTFIVYASGKSAEEMLDIARQRMENPRGVEIDLAAQEQRRITATRLRRMLCVGDES